MAVKELGPLYFRRMKGWHLLTNDHGQFLPIEDRDMDRLFHGKIEDRDPLVAELRSRGFIRDQIDFAGQARHAARKQALLRQAGPSLHMLVVTLRCNQRCHYCHSSVVHPSRTDTDMDAPTARRVVDFIFSTPNPTLTLEFQGGEPLLNWPVVKFVVEYARLKSEEEKRKALVALVSNFTLLNEERLTYLLDHYVSLCTSLDGPAQLHDKNRPFLGGGLAHEKVVGWLKKIQDLCRERQDRRYYLPGALMTTTRFSLGHHRQIIDLYAELGLEQIFIRPLSPIGYAKRVWHEIGYSPEEFIEFYANCLDYVLELNRDGATIMERTALILLTKILKGEDPGFMDLRSPAGAVLGCLAYNFNGDIFVSDEGRMVDHQGDPMFGVGNVFKSDWHCVIDHPTTRACAAASTLDNQPLCSQCAYKPYCGVCPVFHYETQSNIAGNMPSSAWCKVHMGVFDVLFERLRDPRNREVFERWMKLDQCRWQENEP